MWGSVSGVGVTLRADGLLLVSPPHLSLAVRDRSSFATYTGTLQVRWRTLVYLPFPFGGRNTLVLAF